MTWLSRLKKQTSPGTHPTEPTKPGFVGFVGTLDGHIQKIEGDSLAANDPALDHDRWSYPSSSAMNTAEIDRFKQRLERFVNKGLAFANAEKLADRLVIRDREGDCRVTCLECIHLSGKYCKQWKKAEMNHQALPADLLAKLQNCPAFDTVQRINS